MVAAWAVSLHPARKGADEGAAGLFGNVPGNNTDLSVFVLKLDHVVRVACGLRGLLVVVLQQFEQSCQVSMVCILCFCCIVLLSLCGGFPVCATCTLT